MKTSGFLAAFILIINSVLFPQRASFYSLNYYARSIKALGLGEQGVASLSAHEAMQYNPAGLAFSDSMMISIFRNPNYPFGFDIPLTSLKASLRMGKYGNIGIEYTNYDYGEATVSTADSPDGNGEKFHFYQKSFALNYAYKFNRSLSAGIQFRYAWQPQYKEEYYDGVMISAGMLYTPQILDDRITFGASFMNFGEGITYSFTSKPVSGEWKTGTNTDPLPAEFNLGFEAEVIRHNFFSLIFSAGTMKPITSTSSLKGLFNDWDNFPNDMTASLGIGYVWNPIHLSKNISYLQEFYIGYKNVGPNDYTRHYFTNGIKIGLNLYGIKAMAGIAGRWYDSNKPQYLPSEFPDETFQFDLSTNFEFLNINRGCITDKCGPVTIVVSGGYTYGLVTGKMKEMDLSGVKFSFSDLINWNVEADFYINKNSAILASFGFTKLEQSFKINSYAIWRSVLEEEAFSFESGYRYHPLEICHPIFVQASVGVIRINPVNISTTPDYLYKTFSRLGVGALIPIGDSKIVFIPKFGLRTIFMELWPSLDGIHGFNQFEFGLNVGYSI